MTRIMVSILSLVSDPRFELVSKDVPVVFDSLISGRPHPLNSVLGSDVRVEREFILFYIHDLPPRVDPVLGKAWILSRYAMTSNSRHRRCCAIN